MRHEHLFKQSLKRLGALPPRALSVVPTCTHAPRRSFSSTPLLHDVRQVAILGGGITGLASAYYIARADPKAKITLFEASNRLGGWMQSQHVDVEGGRVLFEGGPRTLRSSGNGLVTAKLLEDLDLEDNIIYVPKDSPAARNRYIYYPDRLVRMPGPGDNFLSTLWNVWSNRSVFKGALSGIWRDCGATTVEPATGDESVGAFIARRFDGHLADNVASAVYHGIYAGDIYSLSVRSLAPLLPYLEQKYGSCAMGLATVGAGGRKIMERRMWDIAQDEEMEQMGGDLYRSMKRCSVFTLRGGLGHFTNRLEEVLMENENIKFKRSSPIEGVRLLENEGADQSRSIAVTYGPNGHARRYDAVVSTLGHNTLAKLINAENDKEPIDSQPTVSVMLVSLYFRNPSLLDANPGFGYLIPRSVPYAQNPECALGVVFDGYAAPGQDTASGTKVTVMLGGHWWNALNTLPGEEEGLWMARTVIARHLGITEEPAAYQARLQRDCIPQYTVGHNRRMGSFHTRLLRSFGGRLRVAGASYGGVGVNDCIRGAYDIGKVVKEKGWTGAYTGLERYSHDKLDVIELAQPDARPTAADRLNAQLVKMRKELKNK